MHFFIISNKHQSLNLVYSKAFSDFTVELLPAKLKTCSDLQLEYPIFFHFFVVFSLTQKVESISSSSLGSDEINSSPKQFAQLFQLSNVQILLETLPYDDLD